MDAKVVRDAIANVTRKIVVVKTGTVVSDNAEPSRTQVVLDNDETRQPVAALGLNQALPAGTRVSCLAYPPRGLLVLGVTGEAPVPANVTTAIGTAVAAGHTLVVSKANDQLVTNSTTSVGDNELFVTLQPGFYNLRARISVIGPTGGDVRISWNNSGSMSIGLRSCTGPQADTTTIFNTAMRRSGGHARTTAVIYGTDGANFSYIEEEITITVTVAGTWTMFWAQGTANLTGTTVKAGSCLMVTPLRVS